VFHASLESVKQIGIYVIFMKWVKHEVFLVGDDLLRGEGTAGGLNMFFRL